MHALGVVSVAARWGLMIHMKRLLNQIRGMFSRQDDSVGARGERAAERYLRQLGYKALARNLRSKLGEIDLLMLTSDGGAVVLVEVKSSENRQSAVPPEARVGQAKQRKLTVLAKQLIHKHKLHDRAVRFDVVGVDLRDGEKPEIRHYVNAFEAAW